VIRFGNGVDYIPARERRALRASMRRRLEASTRGPLILMGDAAEDAREQSRIAAMLKLLAKGKALPETVTGAELSAFLSDVIAFGEKAVDMPWFSRLVGTATKETNLRNALADARKLRPQITVSWWTADTYKRGTAVYDAVMKVAQRIYQEGVGAAATKTVLKKAEKQLVKDLTKPLTPDSAFMGAWRAFWKAHRLKIIAGGVVIGGLLVAPYVARAVKGARAVRSIAGGDS